MHTQLTVVFTLTVAALSAVVAPAFAQSGATGQCAPVTARNPQEALMMEGSSHHNGCWERLVDGQLVFVSKDTPDKSYKPVIESIPAAGCVPRLRAAAVVPRMNADLSGNWEFTTGVWPGESELAIIQLGSRLGSGTQIALLNGCQAVDLETFTGSIVRRGMQFCSVSETAEQSCLNQVGPSTYREQNGTSSCTYELEGDRLRGACSDTLIPGRIVLTEGRRTGTLRR
jgi:hypothetical protein